MNNDIAELTEKLHIFMTDHDINISGQYATLVVEHLLELLTKNKSERGSPRARRTVLASIIACVDALNEQNLGLMKAAIWYQMDLLALLEAVPQSEQQGIEARNAVLEEAANAASTCDIRAIGEGAIRIRIANKIRALKSQLASVEPSK